MKGAIRKVLADHLPAILAKRELSEREWRGAYCVATCRTAQQGTHVRECSEGHGVGLEAFNSCRHRSCPQCGWLATQHWIEQRQMQVPQETLALPPGTPRAFWEREANRQGLRKWNVRVEPPYTETGHVIRYIGAYLKCGPLSDRRVVSYDGQTVCIAHRHPNKHLSPTYELSGRECARRLLLHMPEPGMHTSRFYAC